MDGTGVFYGLIFVSLGICGGVLAGMITLAMGRNLLSLIINVAIITAVFMGVTHTSWLEKYNIFLCICFIVGWFPPFVRISKDLAAKNFRDIYKYEEEKEKE